MVVLPVQRGGPKYLEQSVQIVTLDREIRRLQYILKEVSRRRVGGRTADSRAGAGHTPGRYSCMADSGRSIKATGASRMDAGPVCLGVHGAALRPAAGAGTAAGSIPELHRDHPS